MKEAFVSIIIPAYNVSQYLEECVYSLLNQTYTDFEIIIVDDGSTDNTYSICDKLALENNKIRIFHQKNQGVSVARNIGMKQAKGKYYIFCDADDVVAPQYIEALVMCMENADTGIIGFTSKVEDLSMNINLNVTCSKAKDVIEKILNGTNYDGYLWNKIFQKKIIEDYDLGFKQNITVWEDLLFVLEYLKKCERVAILGNKLYYYRCREGSAVNNLCIDKYRSKFEIMAEIKEHNFAQTSQSAKRISFLYFETMFTYVNQLLIQKKIIMIADKILSNVNIAELVKQKNVILILKFIYLRIRVGYKH